MISTLRVGLLALGIFSSGGVGNLSAQKSPDALLAQQPLKTSAGTLSAQQTSSKVTKDRLKDTKSDYLKSLYVRAYNLRHTQEGLVLADSLRRKAIEYGDRTKELQAMSVPIYHYYQKDDETVEFEQMVEALMAKSLEYDKPSYYYFGVNTRVIYLTRFNKYIEAFRYLKEQTEFAKRHGHHLGVAICYRSEGTIHFARKEYFQAIAFYRQSIDYAQKHGAEGTIPQTYQSLCDTYRQMNDFENQLAAAKEAMSVSSLQTDIYKALTQQCYALFMLNRTGEFAEMYRYLKSRKPDRAVGSRMILETIEIAHLLYEGKLEGLPARIDALGKAEPGERKRWLIKYYQYAKQPEKAYAVMKTMVTDRHDAAKRIHDYDQQSMEEEYRNNELEKESQRMAIENTRLALSNTQLQLNNSSIELSRTKDATRLAKLTADRNLLSYRHETLVSKQLQDSIRAQELLRKTNNNDAHQRDKILLRVACVVILLIIFTLLHLLYHRRASRKLRQSNEELETSIAELDQTRRRALDAEQAKTRFIQNMSHELRTPLNAIAGFSQVLVNMGEELDATEKHDASRLIAENANLLTTLVDDLLVLTSYDMRKITITMGTVQVNRLCRETLETVRHRKAPEVELRYETEVPDDYEVKTDAQRVRQVLINLLTNAEKNTVQGNITLRCSLEGEGSVLRFTVTDTGVGVPKDKMEAIFQRFQKLDDHKQGTGLGLDICRNISAKLGGEIHIDPDYTGGARFWFTIPTTP